MGVARLRGRWRARRHLDPAVAGARTPFAFQETAFDERDPMFSPDGRWLAYRSDESGRNEVYVRPFPKGEGRWVISTGGGALPKWRGDGRELFYEVNQEIWAVAVSQVDWPEGRHAAPALRHRHRQCRLGRHARWTAPPGRARRRRSCTRIADGDRELGRSTSPVDPGAPYPF